MEVRNDILNEPELGSIEKKLVRGHALELPHEKGTDMKAARFMLPGFFRVFKNLAKTNSLSFWPPSGSAGSFLGFPGFHNFLLPFVLWSGWSSTQKDGFYSSRTDTVPILQKGRIVVVLVPVLVVVVVVVVIFIIQLNPIIMNRRRSFYLMS